MLRREDLVDRRVTCNVCICVSDCVAGFHVLHFFRSGARSWRRPDSSLQRGGRAMRGHQSFPSNSIQICRLFMCAARFSIFFPASSAYEQRRGRKKRGTGMNDKAKETHTHKYAYTDTLACTAIHVLPITPTLRFPPPALTKPVLLSNSISISRLKYYNDCRRTQLTPLLYQMRRHIFIDRLIHLHPHLSAHSNSSNQRAV